MKNTTDFVLSKNIRHFVQNAACVNSHLVTHQTPHSLSRFRFAPIFGVLLAARDRLQRGFEGFWVCGRFRGDNGIKRRAELLEGKFISDVRPLHKERPLESEGTSTTKQLSAFTWFLWTTTDLHFHSSLRWPIFTFYRFYIPHYTPQTAMDAFLPTPAFVAIGHHSTSPTRLHFTPTHSSNAHSPSTAPKTHRSWSTAHRSSSLSPPSPHRAVSKTRAASSPQPKPRSIPARAPAPLLCYPLALPAILRSSDSTAFACFPSRFAPNGGSRPSSAPRSRLERAGDRAPGRVRAAICSD